MAKSKDKKVYQIDISNFEELQDLVFQYFYILSEFVKDQNIDIKLIKMDIDSNKIIVEGEELDEDSEESTEPDFEWIWLEGEDWDTHIKNIKISQKRLLAL